MVSETLPARKKNPAFRSTRSVNVLKNLLATPQQCSWLCPQAAPPMPKGIWSGRPSFLGPRIREGKRVDRVHRFSPTVAHQQLGRGGRVEARGNMPRERSQPRAAPEGAVSRTRDRFPGPGGAVADRKGGCSTAQDAVGTINPSGPAANSSCTLFDALVDPFSSSRDRACAELPKSVVDITAVWRFPDVMGCQPSASLGRRAGPCRTSMTTRAWPSAIGPKSNRCRYSLALTDFAARTSCPRF